MFLNRHNSVYLIWYCFQLVYIIIIYSYKQWFTAFHCDMATVSTHTHSKIKYARAPSVVTHLWNNKNLFIRLFKSPSCRQPDSRQTSPNFRKVYVMCEKMYSAVEISRLGMLAARKIEEIMFLGILYSAVKKYLVGSTYVTFC